jgi:autophagy-related protein 5
MQAPRYTYLPLLIPEIRENLVEIALDDQAFAETGEKDWWFEEDVEDPEAGGGEGNFAPQGPCKWYVPSSRTSHRVCTDIKGTGH